MRGSNALRTILTATILFASGVYGMWLAFGPTDPYAVPADGVVFRAKHYRTRGACVRLGNAWVMPMVEGFEVVEVIRGTLPVQRVEIRPHSGAGHLVGSGEGVEVSLVLIPTRQTREELNRMGEAPSDVLWVDGNELRPSNQ